MFAVNCAAIRAKFAMGLPRTPARSGARLLRKRDVFQQQAYELALQLQLLLCSRNEALTVPGCHVVRYRSQRVQAAHEISGVDSCRCN